ncbi:MAG: hypothetical protein ACXWC9_07565 [Pseudobdellovibrionaceae bacterium]
MRAVCFASILFFPAILFAQANLVLDPQNVLKQVEAFLGPQTFASTLACGSSAQFYSPVQKVEFACEGDGCLVTYEIVESAEGGSYVANCSSEMVSIYSDNGIILDISKSDFESRNGNMAQIFLENLAVFFAQPGQVILQSAVHAEYTLFSGKKLPALHVNGEFRPEGMPRSFPILITVIQGAPGVAQVARLRLDQQTWFRLKEF